MEQNLQYKIAEDYWINKISGYNSIGIAGNSFITKENTYEKITLNFSTDTADLLRKISNDKDLNVFVFFATCLHILVYKYSGENDIIITTPCFDLTKEAHKNLLFLRNNLDSEKSAMTLLSSFQEDIKQSYQHRNYLFEKLLKRYAVNNESNASLFNYGLSYSPLTSKDNEEIRNVKLLFDIDKTENNAFNLSLSYLSSLYTEQVACQLGHHFVNIVEAVLGNINQPVADVALLSATEKNKLLVDFNTARPSEKQLNTVVSLFDQQVEKHPENTAVEYGAVSLKYVELNEKANQLAAVISANGSKVGDVVAVVMDRSEKTIISILGILKAGAAYLPIDVEYPDDRISYMLKDSGCKITITTSEYAIEKQEFFAANDQITISVDRLPETTQDINFKSGQGITLNDPAYVIYTSGSTGKPKGVVIPHKALSNFMYSFKDVYKNDFTVNDRCLGLTNIAFDVSVCEIFIALVNGASLILLDREIVYDPEKLAGEIIDRKITFAYIPPILLKAVYKTLKENQAQVKLNKLLVGVESIKDRVLFDYMSLNKNLQIVNGYGPTESTISCTLFPYIAEEPKGLNVSIGKPVANTQIYILGADNQLKPIGMPGELCISGEGLALGYLNNPALTNEKFVANPFNGNSRMYRTGDLAKWLPDGNIEFIGRKDFQVKIRGYRVELGEIESQLLNYSGIKEALVLARDDEENNKYLCAYFVADETLNISAVREHLLKELPEYMVPSFFIQMESFPITSNGKVDRQNFPEPTNQLTGKTAYEGPKTNTEKRLTALWEEVLSVTMIGINDNFFEIGGHSLKAARLVSLIHQQMQVEVPLRQLFKTSMIQLLAAFIDEAETSLILEIPAAATADFYPLSFSQRRLYIEYLLNKDALTYNMPAAFYMDGALDINKLNRIFETIIQRHETLRTSFSTDNNGNAIQQVHEKVDFAITYKACTPEEINNVINAFIKPFDLSKAPLLRVSLLRISNDQHLFLFDMHHIISDAVSFEIIIKEFAALYNDQLLAPLNLHYKDYAAWLNNYHTNAAFKKQESYWVELYNDQPEVLNLPYDHPDTNGAYVEGKTFHFSIDTAVLNDLKKHANASQSTLYMLTLAAYNILLSKYSGQEDIVVGTPLAGRDLPGMENIIGMFVNALPIRNFPDGEKTFNSFLKEVKENFLNAFDNQLFPMEELVDKLGMSRDHRNPLFNTMFVYQNPDSTDLHLNGLILSPYALDIQMPKFDLSLEINEQDAELSVRIDYSGSLFSRETIERFSTHFTNILIEIINDPDKKIKDVQVLSKEEIKVITNDFNATHSDCPQRLIHHLFEEQVSKNPGNVAVVFENASLTYNELNEKAESVAAALNREGVKPGDIVGVLGESSEKLIIDILAIFKTGGVYLPIDPQYPEERIKYILENSRFEWIIVNEELPGKLQKLLTGGNQRVIAFDTIQQFSGTPFIAPMITPDSLAYIIYTSGSTGRPKGVTVEHRSFVNMISAQISTFEITEKDNCLQFASPSFDASLSEIFMALLSGASLTLVHKHIISDPIRFKNFIESHKISVATLPPAYLSVIEPDQITPIKKLITAGETIKVRDWNRFSKGRRLFNAYGPTEASVCTTIFESDDGKESDSVIPIGKPINNTRVFILDKYQNVQPLGVTGELCIAGIGLAKGYLNNPDLTAEKFILNKHTGERMYKTGDSAKWLPDGNIVFQGRMDQQVKIRGYRIEIGEVEKVLLQHEDIKETVVVDQEDMHGNKYLAAYYVPNKSLNGTALSEYMSQYVPAYMVPSFFIELIKLPVTPNGKIDKKALPDANVNQAPATSVKPTNLTEEKLVLLWQGILSVDEIGITDNFFELGGQSLKAMTLVSRIQKEFNVEVSINDVFQKPTIKGISNHITHSLTRNFSPIVPVSAKPHYNLSSAQKRIYVMSHFEGAETSYNMPGFLWVDGYLDVLKLKNAFFNLIKRHESLRTSFQLSDGEPVQIISESIEFEIEYLQVKGEELNSYVNDFIKEFDLTKAPLLRVKTIEINPARHLLMYDMNHIIGDGLSMNILVRDLIVLYHEKELPPIKLQYKDYAVWQKAFFNSVAIESQKEYWQNEFEGEIPALQLPYDFPRPAVQSFEGNSFHFKLDRKQSDELVVLAREKGVTINMLMLSVYTILLSRYSGQYDIIVGTPVAGRPHADLEEIIGMFVNTLALRNYPTPDKSFEEFLSEVKSGSIKAYENQDYPFEELVESLSIKRDLSRNPLFDTLFLFLNSENKEAMDSELKIYPYDYKTNTAKFDITFEAIQTIDSLEFIINYSTNLFKPATIEQLALHFQTIVDQVILDPGIRLKNIDLVTEHERRILLEEFNKPLSITGSESILDIWEAQVNANPGKKAVISGKRVLTYQQVNEKANSLAAYILNNYTIEKGDLLAIMLNRSELVPVTILAVLKTGAAYVPIDPDFPSQRIEYILTNSNCKLVISNQDVNLDVPVLNLTDFEFDYAVKPTAGTLNVNAHDLAYVTYTSGSTGQPKGVMLEHGNVVGFNKNLDTRFNITKNDTILAVTNITFDISVLELLCSLMSGLTVVVASDEEVNNPSNIETLIENYTINILQFTPSRLKLMVDSIGTDFLNGIKTMLIGGEAMSESLFNFLRKLNGLKILNVYGPTETCIWSTALELKDEKLTIGKPLENEQVFILDPFDKLQPIGIAGEICISGAGIARGYFNNQALTNDKFITLPGVSKNKMYKTGDIGRWLSDGTIEYLGRKDNQVKIRGYRIELGEIENALGKHEKIRTAIARVTEASQAEIIAYYESETQLNAHELRTFLSGLLPVYMIPAYFVHRDSMPLTPSGKVDRNALKQTETPVFITTKTYEEPVGEVQKQLAEIWKQLLEYDPISIHDNFFEIGGNSIKLIQVLNKIHTKMDKEISLMTAFKFPTIKELADLITTSDLQLDSEVPYVVMNPENKKTLFFFPPAIGYSFIYGPFAELLDEYKVCCFHFIEDESRIEKYIDYITTEQPVGPYILSGYSVGGNFAFEIAKELEKRNHPVSDIILIDSYKRVEQEKISEGEIEKMATAYLESMDTRIFASQGLAYINRLKERAKSKIMAYQRHISNGIDSGTIKGTIHQVTCEEMLDSSTRTRNWSANTTDKFVIHHGKGAHPEMLNEPQLKYNVELVKNILLQIHKAVPEKTF